MNFSHAIGSYDKSTTLERQERTVREIREAREHEEAARGLLLSSERLRIEQPALYGEASTAGVQGEDEETRGLAQRRLRSLVKEAIAVFAIEKFRRAIEHLKEADARYWEIARREVSAVTWFAGTRCKGTRRRLGYGIDAEDMAQHDLLGVYEAALRYDPDRGIAFGTYARHWVRAERVRMRQKGISAFTVTGHASDQMKRVDAARRDLDVRGLPCTREEVAHAADVEPSAVEHFDALRSTLSLDARFSDFGMGVGEERIMDLVPDDEVEERIARQEGILDARSVLMVAMSELTQRQREILSARFGFNGATEEEPPTLRQLGTKYGLSREWVRIEEAKALRVLREVCSVDVSI